MHFFGMGKTRKSNLCAQGIYIRFDQILLVGICIEITITTAMSAKGDVNVEAGGGVAKIVDQGNP